MVIDLPPKNLRSLIHCAYRDGFPLLSPLATYAWRHLAAGQFDSRRNEEMSLEPMKKER